MVHSSPPASSSRRRAAAFVVLVALTVGACGASAVATPQASASRPGTTLPAPSTEVGPTQSAVPSAAPSTTPATDTGGGTTSGDIPDNAVFLTYAPTTPAFSIDYVEGWQVTPQRDGVVIRDKDSSETVAIAAPTADVSVYVSNVDLASLRSQPGFQLVKQDTVAVNGSTYVHLVYHVPAPPDPVTGKQVPSTVDRYYVPGATGLAIVSLSTPDGVDNVDAFLQMIRSFTWR